MAGTECCRTQASPQYTGRITDIIGHILPVIRLSVCRNACWQSWQQSVTGNRNLLHVLISWEILQSLAKIPEFYFYSEVQSDWGGWISSCWQKIKKQVCKTIKQLKQASEGREQEGDCEDTLLMQQTFKKKLPWAIGMLVSRLLQRG